MISQAAGLSAPPPGAHHMKGFRPISPRSVAKMSLKEAANDAVVMRSRPMGSANSIQLLTTVLSLGLNKDELDVIRRLGILFGTGNAPVSGIVDASMVTQLFYSNSHFHRSVREP